MGRVAVFIFAFFMLGLFSSAAYAASYANCADAISQGVDFGGRSCVDVASCITNMGSNTYYLLTQDINNGGVSCYGGAAGVCGCFNMNGANSVLDLNEHTLSFAVNPVADTDNLRAVHMTRYASGSEVKNGNIIETSNHDFGGTNNPYLEGRKNGIVLVNCDQCKLHDIYFESRSYHLASVGVFTSGNHIDYAEVYNNMVKDYDTRLGTSQIGAGMIHVSLDKTGTISIHDNHLDGPAFGITVFNAFVDIYNNVIYPMKIERNPYGIRLREDVHGGGVYNNTIISNNSRGILIEKDSSNLEIYNNYVDVAEVLLPGIDGGNSHALRVRPEGEDCINNYIHDNTFIARAYDLPAISARLSDWQNNTYVNNTFIALTYDPSWSAQAVDLEATESMATSTFADNTLISNYLIFNIGAEMQGLSNCPPDDGLFVSNTFERVNYPVDMGASFETLLMGTPCDADDSLNHNFVDTRLVNGPSFDSIWYKDEGTKSLDVRNYLDVLVQDTGENPLNNALVEIRSFQGTLTTLYTDSTGTIPRQTLTDFSEYTNGLSPSRTEYSPYNITVTYGGDTLSRSVDLNESREEVFTFDFSGTDVSSIECEKDSVFGSCSNIGYGETISRVRATCADDGFVTGVSFTLTNQEDGSQYFSGSGSDTGSDIWTYTPPPLAISDSGTFSLEVSCMDNDANMYSESESWSVPWGTLSASHNLPVQDPYAITDGSTFTYQTTIECNGGECGDVTATLDPFQDAEWVEIHKETFDTPQTLMDGQPFGEDNWLVPQLINNGTITVQNGYALINTSDFWNAALIHTVDSLPSEYKMRMKAGYINYDSSNYEAEDFNDPRKYTGDENGFYMLTMTDALCSGSQCAESWWHYHRKAVMDIDNHQTIVHPVYMIYMGPGLTTVGNELRSWDGSVWHTEAWNWEVAHTYDYDTWYYAEIEKRNGLLTLRLYDGNENILEETTPVPLSLINAMDDPTEYLYLGEPHTDDYEGDVRIDDITLLVPQTESYSCGSDCYSGGTAPGCSDYNSGPTCNIAHNCDGTNAIDNIVMSKGPAVLPGEQVNVTVAYDCYSATGDPTSDVVALWYHDGNSWQLLNQWTQNGGELTNCDLVAGDTDGFVTTSFTVGNTVGQHTLRAIEIDPDADWPEETSACPTPVSSSNYGDFDDLSFEVSYYSSKGGDIPQEGGSPFYADQNPQYCPGLNEGETCVLQWIVTANVSSGAYDFYVNYDPAQSGISPTSSPHNVINVTATACTIPYDSLPCDDCIDSSELISAIDDWYKGVIGISDVIQTIKLWKQGC